MVRIFTLLVIGFSFALSNLAFSNNEPFVLELETVTMPGAPAIHSFNFAQSNGKWLFVGGRTNGLHGFTPGTAFPRASANRYIYVVDPSSGQVWSRNLFDDLSITEADPLRSTNMQHHQAGNKLYITGGYGLDSTTGQFKTFPVLTVMDVEETIQAIINSQSIASHVRQVTDTRVKVCGGESEELDGYFYLIGGHDFNGIYFNTGQGTNDQTYTNSYKKFQVSDNGSTISIINYSSVTDTVNLHRRDFNLVPAIKTDGSEYLIDYGGVFQYDIDLPYLNPVYFDASGHSVDGTFEQKGNQYTTAFLAMFDSASGDMYTTFFGGTSLYYYDEGSSSFVIDSLVPFIDDITLVTRQSSGTSTETDLPLDMPGLLGTNAHFILDPSVPHYDNETVKFHEITQRTFVGYIFGGIKASAPNMAPSTASDVILKVFITPKDVSIQNITSEIPSEYRLSQNYPNPFNPSTKIRFDVPSSGLVKLSVYNVLGEEVSTLVDTDLSLGSYEVTWDASKVAGGIYFYRLETNGFSQTKKMLLIK